MAEDDSTPPISSYGAQRAAARELAAIRRAIVDMQRLVYVELVLLAFVLGGLFVLAGVVGRMYYRIR